MDENGNNQTAVTEWKPAEVSVPIDEALTHNIAKQERWKNIMSNLHALTVVGSIFCSAAASVVGAKYGFAAAILAGIASVCIGVEKTMMFSEKWKHHLTTETRLRGIQLKYKTSQMSLQDCVEDINKVLETYASHLPIENEEAIEEIKDTLKEIQSKKEIGQLTDGSTTEASNL
jgi:predicted DNA-binding protein YlxM (UPF0122 family)